MGGGWVQSRDHGITLPQAVRITNIRYYSTGITTVPGTSLTQN
jgi:hypothetical protein